MAEAALAAVRGLAIPHGDLESSSHVTVSIGSAALVPDGDVDPGQLVARADRALYRAKALGRNRAVAAT
jgi:hemerythrin